MTKDKFESSVEYDLLHHPLGERFYDQYYLLECLYTSQTSSVYKIEDKKTGEMFTLKAISKDLSKSQLDLDTLMTLDNPHIVKLVSHFQTVTYDYLIKPFVVGVTLKEWVDENGPLSDDEILHLLDQLCHILKNFHHHQLIYRDLKPHNIIFHEGQITLIDLVSIRRYKPSASSDTAYIGTLGYAAPEQFGFGQTDQRTDIYTLGMTLYFLLSGQEVINQQEMVSAVMLMKQNLPPHVASTIRKRLLDMVIKATYLDPDKRYASVDALIDDLHAPEDSIDSVDFLSSMQVQVKKASKSRLILMGLILVPVIIFALILANSNGDAQPSLDYDDALTDSDFKPTNERVEQVKPNTPSLPTAPTLPASSLNNKGIVLSPDGTTLDGKIQGEMIVELRTPSGMDVTHTYCQSDGSFSLDLDAVADGDYHIRLLKDFQDGFASPPAYKVTVKNHLIDSESLQFKLSNPQISGTVLTPQGQPFTEGMTIFYEVDYTLYFLAQVDKEGHFLIGGLVPDRYDLLLHPRNGGESLHMTLDIDDQVDQVTVQLK